MNTPTKPNLITTDSLETIASQANREHQLATEAACSALEHAARCGELLNKAKAGLGHGNFLPWLKENFAGSERTAQNYMRLASNPQRVADLGCDSIRGAIEALTERPKEERPKWMDEFESPPQAPFEIPHDHGLILIPPGVRKGFAFFTPYIDDNFVFISSLEPDTIGDGGSAVGYGKAVLRRFAWHWLNLSRPGVDWDRAEIGAIPPGHEWSGPWDYNHFLYYFGREEWLSSFLTPSTVDGESEAA